MLKIVTDGAADFPQGWIDQFDIQVLPLRIRFGETTYEQGKDLDGEGFYRLVKETHIIPKTTLPAPDQIVAFYRSIARAGDRVLSIHIGSKMSGTFNAVQLAARELIDEIKVTPFDSGAGSAVMAFMCREARLLERAGASLDSILTRLAGIREGLVVIFTVESLEFARMNGRVNALQKVLTSMLNIKPIIILRDGLLAMGDRVRTRHHSIERILEYASARVGKKQVNAAVVHAQDPSTAQMIADRLRRAFNCRELVVTELAIPVAANLGPGTVGIVLYPVEAE